MTSSTPRFSPGSAPAPKLHWYVAAFSNELGTKPLARMFFGEEVVLYRDSAGKVAALEDRCAHRAAALSPGKVVGDSIQCFYHGMRYGVDGRCVAVPSQSAVPSQMRVRSFPVVEKDQFIWIWMGESLKADPAKIPDLTEFDWGCEQKQHCEEPLFLMEIEANMQLLHENLLDISHASFLHEGLLDAGAVNRAVQKIEVRNDRVVIDQTVEEVVTGAYAAAFELPDGVLFHRSIRTESLAPNLNVITNVFRELNSDNPRTYFNRALFPITPKTDRSCHYFTAVVKGHGCTTHPPMAKEGFWNIFLTDKHALESIQKSYDRLGSDTPDVSVRADAGAVQYRRVMVDVLAREGVVSHEANFAPG